MNFFPKFRRIESDEETRLVLAAIAADKDNLILPSHLLERHGEIIGAASMGVVPLVMVWNHTQKVSARDSMHIKLAYDVHMDSKGISKYFIACNKHSPYNGHMKQLGFKPVWETEIFVGGTKA